MDTKNKWDTKSTVRLIAILVFVVGMYLLLSVDLKGYFIRNSSNWEMTLGRIDNIETLYGIYQGSEGNKTSVTGYKVAYIYIVNGVEFRKEILLSASSNELVDLAARLGNRWQIEIYYKKARVAESYLNTDVGSDYYKHLLKTIDAD